LIRAITAFHDLIDNKIQNRQQQEESDTKRDQEASGTKGDKDAKKAGSPNGEQEEQDSSDKNKKKN
jgi:26S proteasome regulatory subunit N8